MISSIERLSVRSPFPQEELKTPERAPASPPRFQPPRYKTVSRFIRASSVTKLATKQLINIYTNTQTNRFDNHNYPQISRALTTVQDRWQGWVPNPQCQLGSGTGGNVYLLYDAVFRKPVAVKINTIPPDPNSLSLYCFRVEQETFNLAHWCRIPYTVKFHGSCSLSPFQRAFVMAHAGPTLQELVNSSGPLPLKGSLTFLFQLLESHKASSSLGWIHGDLKASNVMFNNGKLAIIDFGLSELGKKERDFANKILSLFYRDVKVILGHSCDSSVDLWSIGILTYYSLFGQYLFGSFTDDVAGRRYTLDRIHHILGYPPAQFLENCSERRLYYPMLLNQEDLIEANQRAFYRNSCGFLNFSAPFDFHFGHEPRAAIEPLVSLLLGIFRYENRIGVDEALRLCKKALDALEQAAQLYHNRSIT